MESRLPTSILPWLVLGLGLAHLFAASLPAPPFTADSWTFLELARTFNAEFYAARTWRSFDSVIPYSRAFPPLWPAIVAAVDRVTGLGIYSGYIAAFAAYVGFAFAAEQLARQLAAKWVGITSATLLLVFAPLREEIVAARSMPLFLLLLAAAAGTLGRLGTRALYQYVVLGVFAGLMVMTRFDGMLAAITLLAAVPLATRTNRASAWVASIGAFAVTVSPWVVYSLTTFGEWFATDNARVALSARPAIFVLDYFTAAPPTLIQAPGAWLSKVIWHLPLFVGAIGKAFLYSVFAVPLIIVSAWLRLRRSRDQGADHCTPRQRHAALVVLTLACMLALLAQVTTGYFDLRYFSPLVWSVTFLSLWRLSTHYHALYGASVDRLVALSALATPLALFAQLPMPDLRTARFAVENRRPIEFTALLRCLAADGASSDDTVLFFRIPPYKFAALTGWRASPTPTNWAELNDATRGDFLRKYSIRYVVAANADSLARVTDDRLDACSIPVGRVHLTAAAGARLSRS